MANDFTMKPMVDPIGIARLAQEQVIKNEEIKRQNKLDSFNMLQQTAKSVGDLVGSAVEASKARQKRDMINSLAASMASQVPNLTVPVQGPQQMTPGPVSQPISLGTAQTPDIQGQNAVRRSVQLNPDAWTKQLAEKTLPTPLQIAGANLKQSQTSLTGAKTGEITGQMLPNTKPLLDAAYQKAGITPTPGYESMSEKQAQEEIKRATDLAKSDKSVLSPYAEIRKQMLISSLNDKMSKKMNPANWSPGTMAGKSAALVANADSAINLANQMLEGTIPTTEQTMTSLALDANRVLTQTGTVSEKTTAELKAKTGVSTIAQGIQYFTNHPTDQKLQEFVKILKTEVQRQRDQRQAIVDRTLSGELSSLNQLRRLSPDDWEQQITANGFDLEAAKKGKLKIDPQFGSTMYGWDIGDTSKQFKQPGGIQIDQNALDAELKRRGLQ